ncbi:MAG: DnaD domain protein [Eubacterium sp.]|nr:DnaD domain protein [Eubacterium sp.]
MNYRILPLGELWSEGMFSVPSVVTSKYLRLASDFQIKALLLILSKNGCADSAEVSKALGVPESEVCELLSFWVEEGVLCDGESTAAPAPAEKKEPEKAKVEKAEPTPAKQLESVPVPTYSTSDIVEILTNNEELLDLINTAQEVLSSTLSHHEKSLIINMYSYYGLPGEVVLTILQYCQSKREKGLSIGNSYIAAMAKNWSEEGINTLALADEKLKELEVSDKKWNEVVELSGIRHKRPTQKQREMVTSWYNNFSSEMIELACDAMRENAERPSLKYVNKVLTNWQKKNIKTPEDVEKDNQKHREKKESKNPSKLEGKPSFDIDELQKKALMNDNFDI